jgi:hypothetical protein
MSIQDAAGPQDTVGPHATGAPPQHNPQGPQPSAPGPIWLVIEQNVGSSGDMRWGVDGPQELPLGTTWAQARAHAEQVARTFGPRHPLMENGRTVMRVDENSFLTIVRGATSSFHFRVTLGEPI